jgi:BolA family transcriptional regulator, general stress-responsive regulator
MSVHQTVKHTITNKLREAFAPESLDVTDESHLHEGHAGQKRSKGRAGSSAIA